MATKDAEIVKCVKKKRDKKDTEFEIRAKKAKDIKRT